MLSNKFKWFPKKKPENANHIAIEDGQSVFNMSNISAQNVLKDFGLLETVNSTFFKKNFLTWGSKANL